MDENILPRYIMRLIVKLEQALWDEFPSSKYKNALIYIKKWYETNGEFDINYFEENFHIYYKDEQEKEIDLSKTLHEMPMDLVLKIAIDIGLETPDFIPCIPTFKNELKENYKTAFDGFDKAFKLVNENPDLSISLSNSTLESIVKHILDDEKLSTKLNKNKTTYDLVSDILKEFKMFPNKDTSNEIRVISNGLLSSSQHIEKLRSNKTLSHGKTKEDYIIDDPLYAYFVINSITTIGLFLMSFYNKKYKKKVEIEEENKNEISVEDLPF